MLNRSRLVLVVTSIMSVFALLALSKRIGVGANTAPAREWMRLRPARNSFDLKRLVDVTASAIGLLVLLPVFAAIAIIVRVTSPGPVFYRATRVGLNGQPFTLYKFRSMRINSDKAGPGVTGHGDPRITSIGRILRGAKLDELPQLYNVLRGDMSLVGPRPEDARYVAHYTPKMREVLLGVRPGITSPASVYFRDEESILSEGDWEKQYIEEVLPVKAAVDMDYFQNHSVWRDFIIIFSTFAALLPGDHTRTAQAVVARARSNKQRILIVGGPDVDARIELMNTLSDTFELVAAGSSETIRVRFAQAGYEYHTYPLNRSYHPIADLKSIIALYRICNQVRPHIVHTYDTKPSVLARIAAWLAGADIIVGTLPGLGSLYTTESEARLKDRVVRMVYETLQRASSRVSDATVFQNTRDFQQMTTRGIVPAHTAQVIASSGVKTQVFDRAQVRRYETDALRAEWDIPQDALIVTMISRIIRAKGVMEFAQAARIVKQTHPDVHFLLVGPIDQDSDDKLTTAEMSEVMSAVQWVGVRTDVRTILAASDIFTLPTYYREGIPRVLLEASSMGVPSVTTDMPGCSDVVEDGVNGLVIEPRSVEALAEALTRLIEDANLRRRLSNMARARALEEFDLGKISAQTRAVYANLLNRKLGVALKTAQQVEQTQQASPVVEAADEADVAEAERTALVTAI